MRKSITVIAIFSLMFLGFSSLSHGAGFLIYEHGAAAMAMGGAFVGLANNPTAVFHNPAGIAFLDGTQISFGTTLIFPVASLSMPDIDLFPVTPAYSETYDQASQVFYPSNFYITHKVSDRVVAGFGFFSPYGLGTEWPNSETFPLRYLSTKDDMKTFFFNPTLAFKLNENLSLGVGVSYVHSTLKFYLDELLVITPPVPPLLIDVPASLDAKGSAWGLNAGVLYKGENFSLGFNWRGGFTIDYEDGDLELNLENVQAINPAAPDSLEGTVSTSFKIPHIFGVGGAFNLSEKLMFTADFHYIAWSSFERFVAEVDVPNIELIYPPGLADKEVEENWKDSWLFRFGFQYMANENLALRAGFLYDKTPQPDASVDPILPDANRMAFTGGFGYKAGNFVIDVAYQYEPFADRASENRPDDLTLYQVGAVNLASGTYKTTAHLIGVSIGFIF